MEYKQVCYFIKSAEECGEKRSPLEVMEDLGFKIIASVPQTLYNAVWFTVQEYIENPPEFITKISYNFDYWHNDCYKNCEYFKKDNSCCWGGEDCLKNKCNCFKNEFGKNVCYGTKNKNECKCNGDKKKCDFYIFRNM